MEWSIEVFNVPRGNEQSCCPLSLNKTNKKVFYVSVLIYIYFFLTLPRRIQFLGASPIIGDHSLTLPIVSNRQRLSSYSIDKGPPTPSHTHTLIVNILRILFITILCHRKFSLLPHLWAESADRKERGLALCGKRVVWSKPPLPYLWKYFLVGIC
jgi:hypothetical protein